MKRLILLLVAAAIAFAADVTGNWSAQINDQSGNALTINYKFQQDGTKLSGTVTGPGGDLPIQEGKVDGDKISFNITFDGGNGPMKVASSGTVKGDEIAMTITVNGQQFGGPVTLKRAK
jgi:autotransporter translocation and assembly factor TamB